MSLPEIRNGNLILWNWRPAYNPAYVYARDVSENFRYGLRTRQLFSIWSNKPPS